MGVWLWVELYRGRGDSHAKFAAIVGALDRGGVEIEDQRLRRIEVGWQGQPDFVPALFTADGDDAEGPIVGLDTYLHRRYVRGAWVGEDEDQCCRAPRCGRGEADLPP